PKTVAGATIAVPEQDTSFFIHRDFVKVEQGAVLDPAVATLPNAAFALDRVVRREVGHTPAITTIECRGHEQVPISGEIDVFVITSVIGPKEAARRTAVAAGDRFRKRAVDYAMADTQIGIFRPGGAVVGANLHMHVSFTVVRITDDVKNVDLVVRIDRD